jgi:hypothetical protein
MKRKTFVVPDEPKDPAEPQPVFSFGLGRDGRDTTQPVAYDENGQLLYAPRGIMIRWHG